MASKRHLAQGDPVEEEEEERLIVDKGSGGELTHDEVLLDEEEAELHEQAEERGHRRGGCGRRCCSWAQLRGCPELCRSEGFMMRNEDSPLQVEMYLVCSAATILLIRVGLYATGYPQLGGDGIHIAHMLWGGLLMFLAQMLSFCFLGLHVQRLAAVLGGIGFGTFIDELGKFITSDNDYFFKPTPFLLYTGFCVLFLVLKCVEPLFNPQRFSKAENLANALHLLGVYSTSGLSKESKLLLIELLENSDQTHPVVPSLKAYVARPISESGIPTSQEHYYLRYRRWVADLYGRAVRNKYTTYCINSFFVLQCVTQMLDLIYLLLDGTYYKSAKAVVDDGSAKVNDADAAAAAVTEHDQGFLSHFLASPLMKVLRKVSSGKLSDDLLLEETDHVTKLHIFQLIAVCISAICVLFGVYFLSAASFRCRRATGHPVPPAPAQRGRGGEERCNRRKWAFIWFRRSMLVRLFITDSLSMYHSQFRAFGDVVFTISIVIALSFMVIQEESTDRVRRLSEADTLFDGAAL